MFKGRQGRQEEALSTFVLEGPLYIPWQSDPLFARQILAGEEMRCLDFALREWAKTPPNVGLNIRHVRITVEVIKQ